MCKVLALSAHPNINKIEKFLDSRIILERGSYKSIEMHIGEKTIITHNNVPLEEYDFVWLNSTWTTRDIAFATMKYLEEKKIPHTKVEKSTSKLTDTIVCQKSGVNQPKTFFTQNHNLKINPEELFKRIEKELRTPFIIKDVKGSLGSNIFLIKNVKEFVYFSKNLKGKKQFIIQEFIPNNFDWGVNIANGEIIVISQRIRRDHPFLNNIHQGASEVFVEMSTVDEDIKTEALKAMEALHLNWGRVDIVVGKEDHKTYVLEINRRPGMTVESPEVKAFAGFLQNEIGVLNLL